MHISELMDEDELSTYIKEGYISYQDHPKGELIILNYTPKAQYAGLWDDVTRNCRGLIIDSSGVIIARPLPKFFNYGDSVNYDEEITPDTEVMAAYDKLDGSLGIVYWDPDGQISVATRGSFTSVQALHATEKIRELLIPNFSNVTMLVEIIYPDNQIVIDYKGVDDLFLLGGVRIDSGIFMDPVSVFTEIRGIYPDGGFRYLAQNYDQINTVQDALDNLHRENREGYVLHTYEGTMIKVKQEDYLQMHRLVFQTTKRTLWYSITKSALTSLDIAIDDVRVTGIKAHSDQINDAVPIDDLLKKLSGSIPANIQNAARQYVDSIFKDIDEFNSKFSDFVDELWTLGDLDRRTLYELSLAKFPDVAGKAADAASAVMHKDDDAQDRVDTLVLSVLASMKPAKGDRLTETLNEEDE